MVVERPVTRCKTPKMASSVNKRLFSRNYDKAISACNIPDKDGMESSHQQSTRKDKYESKSTYQQIKALNTETDCGSVKNNSNFT